MEKRHKAELSGMTFGKKELLDGLVVHI